MPGGAAGAVGRITGALGKGIATLTMDEDYKRKRQEAINKRPANAGEGFARGGQSLVMVSIFLCLCLGLIIYGIGKLWQQISN